MIERIIPVTARPLSSTSAILIIDDHEVVRGGCRELLELRRFGACCEASSGEEGWQLLQDRRPQLVILDLSLPDVHGLALIERIRARPRPPRVLVFTMHDDPTFAARALRAGAAGYITKTSPPEYLLEGVRDILAGEVYLSPDMAEALAVSRVSALASPVQALTPREQDVFRLVASGHSNAAAADTLGLSHKSVSNYLVRIKHKLAVDSIADMVRLAMRYDGTSEHAPPASD
ncbi:response regulator transcription factor [Spectribacter hydrogenoxidans]|uniref:Response regulator transcription factor n=1 Tax=Spectribacter hydrogenoxidans TaxID=3075608 RepID=A0ABU3BY75_9GAMM|nr:response regulator transcription factor [Salinisphaera sp. W335]MDT0634252.1 response regulator transcription factor [Salinisphaera sp. W335]